MSFSDLGVSPFFCDRLAQKCISRPTAVQSLVIPPLAQRNNVIFRSATGTGKTFAYLLPALQQILSGGEDTGVSFKDAANSSPALLVCAPTLELCSQIKNEIDFLLAQESASRLNVSLLIGSVNINRQIDSLKKNKPFIAVGNPGRLLLLAKKGRLKFNGLKFLVLDEADRLTADDCREETLGLMRLISAETKASLDRKSGDTDSLTVAACSATITTKIKEFLHPLFEDARLIETDEQEVLREMIEHWAVFSEGRRKTHTLRSLLAAAKPKKALVFLGRTFEAGKIVAALQYHGVSAAGLFGNMDKKDRKEAVDRFRSGKAVVLVSSDLAARGLDIPGISHIIALDVSEDKEVYIHRAGRTGRAGKRGIMVSVGDENEMRRLAVLEKKLGIVVRPKELFRGRVCDPEM